MARVATVVVQFSTVSSVEVEIVYAVIVDFIDRLLPNRNMGWV